MSGTDLWVGVLPKTGALIVFDPALQNAGRPEINVYSVQRDLVRQFDPSVTRTIVRTVQGSQRSAAVAKYSSWKAIHGKAFLESEHNRLEAEVQSKRDQIVARHKEWLSSSGREYKGTTVHGPKRHRVTQCWRCHNHLDNGADVECLACGWIVCSCGACGCGRSP